MKPLSVTGVAIWHHKRRARTAVRRQQARNLARALARTDFPGSGATSCYRAIQSRVETSSGRIAREHHARNNVRIHDREALRWLVILRDKGASDADHQRCLWLKQDQDRSGLASCPAGVDAGWQGRSGFRATCRRTRGGQTGGDRTGSCRARSGRGTRRSFPVLGSAGSRLDLPRATASRLHWSTAAGCLRHSRAHGAPGRHHGHARPVRRSAHRRGPAPDRCAADGSTVELAAASSFSVSFTADLRRVVLHEAKPSLES